MRPTKRPRHSLSFSSNPFPLLRRSLSLRRREERGERHTSIITHFSSLGAGSRSCDLRVACVCDLGSLQGQRGSRVVLHSDPGASQQLLPQMKVSCQFLSALGLLGWMICVLYSIRPQCRSHRLRQFCCFAFSRACWIKLNQIEPAELNLTIQNILYIYFFCIFWPNIINFYIIKLIWLIII